MLAWRIKHSTTGNITCLDINSIPYVTWVVLFMLNNVIIYVVHVDVDFEGDIDVDLYVVF